MNKKRINNNRTFVDYLFKPIEDNIYFFLFMMLVGIIMNVSHRNLFGYVELFADVYIVCCLFSLCNRVLRKSLRLILSCIVYIIATIDACCKALFGTPISPSMVLLAQETTGREAKEFFSQYLNYSLLLSTASIIVLLAFLHAFLSIRKINITTHYFKRPILAFPLFLTLVSGTFFSVYDKIQLYSSKDLSALEISVGNGFAHIYHPLERIVYGLYTNHLIAKQVDGVIIANKAIKIESCKFTSPNIILIIGESANRHHSQLYGYNLPTTPRQLALMKGEDSLTVFTDVIAPWNLTSRVFKQIFSLKSVDDKNKWSELPLFPAVFKKAGYRVTFLSNQFPYGISYTPDWTNNLSGGFFLNHPQLNQQMFDNRNSEVHAYDDELLNDYHKMSVGAENKPQLVIFHLLGQHFQYSLRYKPSMAKFGVKDYPRTDLNNEEKQTIAHYDNATLYNDFVLSKIVEQFRHKEAIIIYLSDHGEECYGKGVNMAGRLTESTQIDVKKYHEEFEIPFWIWCSSLYKTKHHTLLKEIFQARNNRFMTDDLPHLLFYLAGIQTPTYQPERSILSPQYNKKRCRKVLNYIDYDVAIQ